MGAAIQRIRLFHRNFYTFQINTAAVINGNPDLRLRAPDQDVSLLQAYTHLFGQIPARLSMWDLSRYFRGACVNSKI